MKRFVIALLALASLAVAVDMAQACHLRRGRGHHRHCHRLHR